MLGPLFAGRASVVGLVLMVYLGVVTGVHFGATADTGDLSDLRSAEQELHKEFSTADIAVDSWQDRLTTRFVASVGHRMTDVTFAAAYVGYGIGHEYQEYIADWWFEQVTRLVGYIIVLVAAIPEIRKLRHSVRTMRT